MTFRDTFITCQSCGKRFIFTVEKQRQLAESGRPVEAPALCEACTQRLRYGGKLHGRVKWFRADKGYGFIASDGGDEIFFHRDGVLTPEDGSFPSLDEGQEVLYEAMDTPRGPQAIRVEPYQA